jgi:hypothetical protein
MIKNLLIITILFLAGTYSSISSAQELKCNINVVSQEIQRSDRELFRSMQKDIQEFINTRSWTNHVYQSKERIECRILINLKEQIGPEEFKGFIQIQSSRPVYNASYETPIFIYKDNDLHFEYIEDQPLTFNLNTYQSNLTSILAFYAYMILGFDYDSFSSEGGTAFFQKAETIMNNAQNSNRKGWQAFESSDHKNRYWLINSVLDNDYRPVRKFYYQYHRHGLDKMTDDISNARSTMAESIKYLQKVYRDKPDPFMHLLNVVFDIKANEFVNVFSQSPSGQKERVYKILTEIDPSNISKYKKIKE